MLCIAIIDLFSYSYEPMIPLLSPHHGTSANSTNNINDVDILRSGSLCGYQSQRNNEIYI